MLTNPPEFHLVDIAATLLGATPFSVYNTSPPEQRDYVLGHARPPVVVSEAALAGVIGDVAAIRGTRHLIVVDGDD